ncbi:HET-domain-containing protein [Hyaloscypha variabilis F]|uniref:HET-domain-containing protein n=1 Tax=Hyaloscypha variabilis (strain UAMH 11265 / GT02V1 / F) TaxID=1149755 RepID=A0A2J6RUS2_HYAVF|nr:HET-domain-containing protein [Hyaloscypha variabilis F]
MKNSSGVFCGLDMPEEESSAEFVRRWAEDMRQSKEEKARVWSERFKDTKRDVLQQLIAIVDEEFPDEGSGTGKGKDKMQPQELARFFSEKLGDETLDVHYWLLFLAILSKRPPLTSSAAFHPLITTADETNFSTETLGEVYTYEPLDFENQEVRVLVLEPSPNTVSDIYGHMVRLPLKTLASLGVIRYPFAALSYVWGKEEATKTIFLHGKRMKVKPNLFLALKCLRDPVVPTLLWIDALCINQKNNEEKSNQVSLMAQIYYNAGHVLMWVGAENHGSGHALLPLYLYDLEQVFKKRGMSEETEKRLHDLECYAMTLEHNVALHDILQRPYWTRVWIVQEVLLAQKATICCGPFVSSWNSVVEISGCNSTGGGFVNLSYTGHEKPLAGQLGEIYAREHYIPGPKKFLDVLTLGRDREATMHHDYIYAFLGIAKVSPDEFMPDYNKAPDIVYKDTFEFIIKQSNDLDVLNLCKRYKNEEKFGESVAIKWPSWLPDWSDKYAEGRLNEMTSMLTSKGHRSYNASAGRVAEFSLSGDRQHLTIRGILFDSVEFVSQHEWPTSAGEDWEVYRQRWSEDGAVSNPYGTAHAQRLALAHTTFLGQASVDELPVFSGTVMAAEDDLISDAEKSLNFTFFRDPQEPPHPKRLLLPATFSNTALAKTKIDLDSSFEEQCKQAVEAFSETLDEIGKGPTPESLDGPSFNRMIHLTRDIAAISGIKKQCSMFQSRFFGTSLGYIGRGPIPIRQGDLVFILFGAKTPFILRKDQSMKLYRLVGEAYVHGIMGGTAAQSKESTTITII